jgi:hypothetical protein
MDVGQYAIEQGQLVGFPSYVTLRYNDGTDTQQWVKWEELTPTILSKLDRPGTFDLKGEIIGMPEDILGKRNATIKIIVIQNE